MSRLGGTLVTKTITKWTRNSFPNYPSQECYLIINRYINSDTLFNEINSSFKKLKENKQSQTISINNDKPNKNMKDLNKPKKPKKHKASNKQLIHQQSVSLNNINNNNNKSITSLKHRDNEYLSRIKSMDNNNSLTSKSIFNKYELIASDLEQQSKEYNKELIKGTKKRKENIDQYIRKEIAQKQKEKRQKFQDPILTELEHYEMSLPDLISRDNITKYKPPKQDEMIKYDENDVNIINSELTLMDNNNDNNTDNNNDDDGVIMNPYNEIFNGLIEVNDQNKKMNEKELMKAIDWTKLENYVELNGWNNFAEFMNENEDETAIQKYSIPSFLSEIPKRRKTYDRPKAKILGNEEKAFKFYKINEKVSVEAFKYLSNGNIAVLVNNKHYGFIKKHNLPIDIKIGEFHTGYVYDINYFGKIECILEKPNFWSRMAECQRRIINILKYCNGTIEISDKSDPETIRQIFEMSKKNFKRALGMLIKNGVIEIFNESDPDIQSKIILNRMKIDEERYDVGKEVEERMWKSKPIWEYGITAPPFDDIIPDEMKERKKKQSDKYERKFTLRKKKT